MVHKKKCQMPTSYIYDIYDTYVIIPCHLWHIYHVIYADKRQTVRCQSWSNMAQVTSLYYDTEVHLALTQVYILDTDIQTGKNSVSRHNGGRAPLKTLNLIECSVMYEGFQLGPQLIPHDTERRQSLGQLSV